MRANDLLCPVFVFTLAAFQSPETPSQKWVHQEYLPSCVMILDSCQNKTVLNGKNSNDIHDVD